ncbi:MAG TPA: outer membrane lipoprotein carrier protein LolA [Terriglobales bacterium]|jgi:outer membrane lipoprotein-sorting protein
MTLFRMAIVSALACAAAAPSHAQAPAASNPQLESVLTQMDQASDRFKSATADFSWDQYQKVVDEHDVQSGRIYFRRGNRETQMAADVQKPAKKYVVYSNGKIEFFQPTINQLTVKDTGSSRAEVETFLVLGFGGRGHDLPKTYDVTLIGNENIDGKNTAKLELVPKSPRVRQMFSKIVIWVDPAQDVSLRQQAFEPSGDSRTATYTNVRLNSKVPDDVFKIKTDGATKVVKQ